MYQDLKFIRGVPGRAEDIREFLKEFGFESYNPNIDKRSYENPNTIIYWEENRYLDAIDISYQLGQIIAENGEELFLKPKYNINVGDLVQTKGYYGCFVVTKCCDNVCDVPLYHLRRREDGWETIESEPQLIPYNKSIVKTWDDLIGEPISGFYLNSYESEILLFSRTKALKRDKIIASSEKVAKSMLAMAQISQLMPHYGTMITDNDWKDSGIIKHIICRNEDGIMVSETTGTYAFLAFYNIKQRDEFFINNTQLIKDYLMID